MQQLSNTLRICHVVEATAGGSARIVTQLAEWQLAAGHDVTVIYSPYRADTLFLKALHDLKGVRLVTSPMRREIGLHDSVHLLRLVGALWRNYPFDVIHSHCSKAGAFARIAGVFFPRTIKIHTPHHFYTMKPGVSRIYDVIERVLAVFCDKIVAVSALEARHGIDVVGIKPSKIHVITNGVDINYPADRQAARQLVGCGDDTYLVGFVGRLEEAKNPMRLAATFAILAAANPRIKLVVMGTGVLRDDLVAAVTSSGVIGRVVFLEGLDARQVMPGFDCLLSTSDYEAFALVFAEAVAAGVPVVAPPVGGAHEIIIDGETGYMGDFTPQGLADAVLKLVDLSLEARASMSAACRRCASHHNLNTMNEKYMELYAALLKK